MKPGYENNASDFHALGWYGYGRERSGMVFAFIGSLCFAFDGERLFVRLWHANGIANAARIAGK